jgi:hypothetical protein
MAEMKNVTLAHSRWQLDVLCLMLAVIGALIAGAVDFNNDEPQAAVIVIVAFAGLLGFVQPRKAWRWAIIVGLGVPVVYLIATALGYHSKSVPEPGWYASLIALIPAFISTYCGVLLRKILGTS